MLFSDISKYRIQNQHITDKPFLSASDLVQAMCAIQSQDFAMAKWAIGIRLKDSTEQTINETYNNGETLRTHLMRPTWHMVSPNDIYWLLELTAPRIKPLSKSRDKQLELNEEIYSKCYRILDKTLAEIESLTRKELTSLFDKYKIKTNENRLSHIMMRAELDGLVCSGPLKNNKLTYALLEKRVPDKKFLTKEESLAELAKRYFTSHGPATVQDFVWWSGLTLTDARKGLEMNKSNLISVIVESETYWFSDSYSNNTKNQTVHLLPAFDELLISYRDRSTTIDNSINKKAIFNNGIFRPIVVVKGQVSGIWRRLNQKNKVTIEVSLFQSQSKLTLEYIENEVNGFGHFIEKPIELIIKDY